MRVLVVALSLVVAAVASCSSFDPPDTGDGMYASCCGGAGACVPAALVPIANGQDLPRDSCGDALLCAPNESLSATERHFNACTQTATLAEGRCVPACLDKVARQKGLLVDGCTAAHLCVPCFSEIDGSATGACTFGDDLGPSRPAVLFPTCCGGVGRCVPSPLVSASDRTHVDRETCEAADALCVPAAIAASPDFVASSCSPLTGGEGRCLPACLPEVAGRAPSLRQSTCAASELCAPCYDPVDGSLTGACSIGADSGPRAPAPAPYPACCGGLGACVPTMLVSDGDRPHLGVDACDPAAGSLCAPKAFASDVNALPAACTVAATGGEGRCLAACLPEVAKRAPSLHQDGCGQGELCTPCYDGLDASTTGACGLRADHPVTPPPPPYPVCCGGGGRCVQPGLVPTGDLASLGPDTCAADASNAVCAPTEFLRDPSAKPARCVVGLTHAEGRCVLSCVPKIQAQSQVLRQDGCDGDAVCAPCYNPVDGTDTGACEVHGDQPSAAWRPVFANCCGDLGRCLPGDYVPAEDRGLLDPNSCPSSGSLCVPAALAKDPTSRAPACIDPVTGAGRCLPSCLASVAAQAASLHRDTCASAELCVPCYDPAGKPTGACPTDAPGPPPAPGVCCNGHGVCIDGGLVPASERPALGADVCIPRASQVCVPPELASNANSVATPCHDGSVGNAEGRCLLSCIPQIAAQAGRLRQAGCPAGDLCGLCYDPVDGASTGACTLGGDPGPSGPAVVFPTCCGGLGSCVPSALIAASDQSHLGTDTCGAGSGTLCAPKQFAKETNALPAVCRDPDTNAEGRCLPSCLPEIAAQASRLHQASCDAGSLCAPCYNPITGADTAACRISSDQPAGPAYTFPSCCGGLGLCVPGDLVTDPNQKSQLTANGCTGGAAPLCAPRNFVANPTTPPATCHDPSTSAEGRCLPSCLPAVSAQASYLEQATCATGELCTFCYNPATGADTGACRVVSGDQPHEPAVSFSSCCGQGGDAAGRCVPQKYVQNKAPFLPRDSCSNANFVCAPRALVTDPTAHLPGCTSTVNVGDSPVPNVRGACVQSCFVLGLVSGSIDQGSCGDGQKCPSCLLFSGGTCP